MNHVKPICRMAVWPAPADTKTEDPCGGLTGLEFKKCEKKHAPAP
jgi:hypothetical protein